MKKRLGRLSALALQDDQRQEAVDVLYHDIMNKQLKLNTEYRGALVECVTLQYQDSNEDVGRALVADGLVQVDARKEKRLASLVSDYVSAQETAKSERVSRLSGKPELTECLMQSLAQLLWQKST